MAQTVSSSEFQQNVGRYLDGSLVEPVIITHYGHGRHVLCSHEHYSQMWNSWKRERDEIVDMMDDRVLEALNEADLGGCLGNFVYQLSCWLEILSKRSASAKEILDLVDPHGPLASAIAQILPTREGVELRTPENLANVLSSIEGRVFLFHGDKYRIAQHGQHEDDLSALRWKVDLRRG